MNTIIAMIKALGEQGLSLKIGPLTGEARGLVAVLGLILIGWFS